MERWPAPAGLAAEPPGEAVRAWGRLGYPRRALRLHATAGTITERFGGEVPKSEEDLRGLPGVGEYTAAAVRAFAFGLPSVVLDVNVRRVLARRWSGVAEPTAHLTATERALATALAAAAASPSTWAAASMELGATVCTKKQPACSRCPLKTSCAWRSTGFPDPQHAPRRQPRYAGSDRQARGIIMGILRDTDGPVPITRIRAAATDSEQGDRALMSLLDDGLVVRAGPNAIQLPT